MQHIALHWFRRDLRLTDNTALHHASAEAEQVVPVYILSEWKKKHDWTGAKRQQFLCGNLESLSKNLDSIGSRLILRQGNAELELEKLIQETKATALYTNRDPDPFGKSMEEKVAQMCAKHGVVFHVYKDCVNHEADEVLNGEGKPYRVFTPYSKNWLSLGKMKPQPAVKSLGPASNVSSLPLPTLQTWDLPACSASIPEAGERAAREQMKKFIESGRIGTYREKRDLPAVPGTSTLSPYLRYGLISIRELYQRCKAVAEAQETSSAERVGIETYIKELAWREFYIMVLSHQPQVLETDFNPAFRDVRWDSDEKLFAAWKEGQTGFPIVDAGIRQMLETGWMHNRVRMIVSMFLTKDLHVHWRLGESFFMQHLVDGEIASNNGGWQWSAGTGADAAPYFRIQNPWTQTKNYDPEGIYIKKWIPELRDVPAASFLAPPKRPLHRDYPLPIVDHSEERAKTLARFKEARV